MRTHSPYWDNFAKLVAAGLEKYPTDAATEWMGGLSKVDFMETAHLTAGSLAVELGCGPGFTLEWLAKQCRLAVGIDFSRGQLHLASQRLDAIKNVKLICHDLNLGLPTETPKATHYFSIYGAIDFVASPLNLLTTCLGTLAPGGLIVIATSQKTVKALNYSSLPVSCVFRHESGGGRELIILKENHAHSS